MSRFPSPRALLAAALALALGACSTLPPTPTPTQGGASSGASNGNNGAPGSDRYQQQQDSAPDRVEDVSKLPEPVPKKEPLSPYGNPDTYTVYGTTYHVLSSAKGYDKVGIASWYGRKFHGYRTSSGEPYDMYHFTAAHRTLPLPTYARVTNLENGKSVVVRINDRGPFNPDRIIDLSWAAAVRLDMAKQGTAKVRVEALSAPADAPDQPGNMSTAVRAAADSPPPDSARNEGGNDDLYLQAGAFRGLQRARDLEQQLRKQLKLPVTVRQPKPGSLYRVWLGPFASAADRDEARRAVTRAGFSTPIPVK